MTSKICPKCKKEKQIGEFYSYFSTKRQRIRINNYCKECSKKVSGMAAKISYTANKDEKLLYAKNYRKENKDKIIADRKCFKKRQVSKLQNCYIRELLIKKNRISPDFVEKNPEIIETKRLQLRLKRKLKEVQNGKK